MGIECASGRGGNSNFFLVGCSGIARIRICNCEFYDIRSGVFVFVRGVELMGSVTIAKLPNVCGIESSGGEEIDGLTEANDFRFGGKDRVNGVTQSKVEFEAGIGTSNADIVFERNIGGGCGKIVEARGAVGAACANTLIDDASVIESGGATIYMVIGQIATEVGSVFECFGIFTQNDEVKIVVVCGFLVGIGGDGQSSGGTCIANADIGSPAAEINVIAVINHEGGRTEFWGSGGSVAKGCDEF